MARYASIGAARCTVYPYIANLHLDPSMGEQRPDVCQGTWNRRFQGAEEPHSGDEARIRGGQQHRPVIGTIARVAARVEARGQLVPEAVPAAAVPVAPLIRGG